MKLLKNVVYGLLPIIVIAVYSAIYKIDPLRVIQQKPFLILMFLGFYLLQNMIDAIRDKLITNLPYWTVLKARLTGNAYGLILPGWIGQELTRALSYNPKLKNLKKGLGFSIAEGFIDTVAICLLYLVFLPFYFSSIQLIFILVALGNILGWGIGISFIYHTHDKIGKIEDYIMNSLRLHSLTLNYMEFKSYIRSGIKDKFPLLLIISFASFWVQGLYFYVITYNVILSSFITGIYMVGALIPIPSEAGVGELILSLLLSPQNVIITRISYLISNASGFLFSGDLSFKEVKKGITLISKERNGKLLD